MSILRRIKNICRYLGCCIWPVEKNESSDTDVDVTLERGQQTEIWVSPASPEDLKRRPRVSITGSIDIKE